MFKKDESLLFRYNPSPLYVYDIESYDIKGANKAALKQYGYSEEEFLSLNLEDLYPENEKTGSFGKAIVQPAFSGHAGIRKHKKKNGDIFIVDITVEPVKYEGKQFKLVHASVVNPSHIPERNHKGNPRRLKKNQIDISGQLNTLEEDFHTSATDPSGQKELIYTVFENLPGLFYMIDENREYVMWNKNFIDILGYNKQELKQMHSLDIFREEDREWIQGKIEEVLDEGEAVFEVDMIHKNGYPIPHHITSQKLVLGKNLYIMNSAVNIANRKEQEKRVKDILQQKLVLLQEIHHRVKNNLAVISSLLYMQSLYTDHEDARKVLSESQLRIKTMALIHEQLYQSESMSKIDYNLYLEKLTRSIRAIFDSGNNINLKLDCESFEMSLNQAVPCSLLINEIMTNAYKYAFVETGKGNILIRVRTEGDKVIAFVKDDGQGLPDDFEEKKKKSFGFTIIETLLEQLKAEYEIRNNNGVEFLFSFQMKDSPGRDASA